MMASQPRPTPAASGFTIRPMVADDLASVVRLEGEIYPQPWSLGVFKDELRAENRAYLVVIDDAGTVVAYGGLLIVEGDAHITTVAVDPSVRRRRLGTRVMLALVDTAMASGARHLTLEVRMSNAAAQALYDRFGFAPVGLRKNYYRDEDALVMWATDIDTADYQRRVAEIRADLEGAGDG